jgi:hypothetical protein
MALSGVPERTYSPQLGVWELKADAMVAGFPAGRRKHAAAAGVRDFSDADLFYKYGENRQLLVTVAMAMMCGYGLWSLLMAWLWSGIDGPVGKLPPRAYGIALGFLPAVFALLAIRMRWVVYPLDLARWFAALSLGPVRLLASS